MVEVMLGNRQGCIGSQVSYSRPVLYPDEQFLRCLISCILVRASSSTLVMALRAPCHSEPVGALTLTRGIQANSWSPPPGTTHPLCPRPPGTTHPLSSHHYRIRRHPRVLLVQTSKHCRIRRHPRVLLVQTLHHCRIRRHPRVLFVQTSHHCRIRRHPRVPLVQIMQILWMIIGVGLIRLFNHCFRDVQLVQVWALYYFPHSPFHCLLLAGFRPWGQHCVRIFYGMAFSMLDGTGFSTLKAIK